MSQTKRATRIIIASIFINMGLALIKLVSGIVGNSYALVADGIESMLDIFTSVAVWGGLKFAVLPPDDNHPFGHGRAETLAALVVALVVLIAGVIIAIQSVREILVPHSVPRPFTLFILVGVIIVKEILFRRISHAGHEVNSTSLASEAWHQRSDAITSAAAFVGILIAVIGGEKYASADGWAALVASGVICTNGVRLMRSSLAEVMDELPPVPFIDAIRETAESVGGVERTEKCRVRKLGFSYLVDIHVEVNGALPVWRGHEIAHEVSDALRANSSLNVSDVVVHIEPATNINQGEKM